MDGSPQPSKKPNLPYIFAVKLRPAPERRAGLFLLESLFFPETERGLKT